MPSSFLFVDQFGKSWHDDKDTNGKSRKYTLPYDILGPFWTDSKPPKCFDLKGYIKIGKDFVEQVQRASQSKIESFIIAKASALGCIGFDIYRLSSRTLSD